MRIHRHRNRKPKIQVPQYKVNEKIRAEELRVIDDEGQMLGVLPTKEALSIARSKELDLVEVSPKANPPVAKIQDFGQFKYQKEKELRKQKVRSKEVTIKGVRLSVRISDHDKNTRLNQARKFLERGDKVRIEIRLRGREKAHAELAKDQMQKFIEEIKQVFEIRVEQPITKQGARLTAIIARS